MAEPRPSTTTYALLALLAIRPWTGYELTGQLRRSLHYAWPRSEANLYSEQKQLVRLGWATVTKEPVGRRTRNRYAITSAGRRALRAWMRTEPGVPGFEVEGIVRMFFGDQASVEDLLMSMRTTGELAGDAVLELCEIVKDYFVTGGPFPERLHVVALAADLLTDLLDRIESYAREAAVEVAGWETTRGRGLTDDARARFEAILARGQRIARARAEHPVGSRPSLCRPVAGGARDEERERGRSAYAEKRWGDAYHHLTAADDTQSLDPTDLERLAVAAHCIGKNDDSAAAWARAYEAHLAAGDVANAALAAAWCSFGLMTRGEFAMGGGWLGRVQTLCREHDLDCPATWFAAGQTAAGAMFAGDFVNALAMFEETQRYADRLRDPNGMTLSRLGRGQCLTYLGRPSEGLSLLDEVMVAVTNDDVSPLVAGIAFCASIECCQQALDVRRAQEWTSALTRWCEQQPDLVPYRGNCLVHRAEILALHGAWPEAYEEAERARDWLADLPGDTALGNAYYQLGELHRLRGEYADAEAAYKQASQHGHETQPGLGLLRLAQGHVDSAGAAIRRALDETADVVRRAHLLGAYVEVSLAAGDAAAARAAAEQLDEVTARLDVPLLRARAMHARAAVALADGDARAALGGLRSAWTLWHELDAPYDGARARVLIGAACRSLGDEDTAEMELDAARWVFEELGAAPDVERVQKLSTRHPVGRPGGLSLREVQVLRLVAAGKSNRAIADELFLSEKTVHRHVSNIFTKLDVGSRAAATAYAFQHDLV